MKKETLKQSLEELNHGLSDRMKKALEVPSVDTGPVSRWIQTCAALERRLSDGVLRTAVVGTIKSGKSTFINSMFSGDYLRRGAGVITSIVTKVRSSQRLYASLVFKSKDEINSEIRRALSFFPALGSALNHDSFDIADDSDRAALSDALARLDQQYFLTDDSINVNVALISSYLKGYPRVKGIVSDHPGTVVFENGHFGEHREFAANDMLAVYLKDIRLEIDSGGPGSNIEIADCQGSDSPNPLHLVMIQEYLLGCDLVVYVISSRTGLRRADINFLSMIKKMGIMEHLLFVINADFNEHDSIEDLNRVISKSAEDLSLLATDPKVYAFSSLFSLFSDLRDSLTKKDSMRLAQWETDRDLAGFSVNEKKRFDHDFTTLITRRRYDVLISNNIIRTDGLARDFVGWLSMNREIFSSDARGGDTLIKRIRDQHKEMDRVRSMIKSTLKGAVSQVEKETRAFVDRFFDAKNGDIVPAIIDFIKNYTVPYDRYAAQMADKGFADTLFIVFQGFKQEIDRYMAETVNPALFTFVRQRETDIRTSFESVSQPFYIMVENTLSEFFGAAPSSGESLTLSPNGGEPVMIESIKRANRIDFPNALATLDYTASIRTEAFMKLGFYRFISAMKKIMKKGDAQRTGDLSALKSGVVRMKKETEASVVFHFKNLRENTKFQYMFRLIEAVSETVYKRLDDRFSAYAADLSRIRDILDNDRSDKAEAVLLISGLVDDVAEIRKDIKALKAGVRDVYAPEPA
ncbi:MAG: hypothetical protein GXP53_02990 [Deltaproteobacteria bacterium]|nr:hypothetical protein [Deltaproteobacteria bacterium]